MKPLYKNIFVNTDEKYFLIISGIGKKNAKAAVHELFKLQNYEKNSLWVNIGLAGHKHLKIGSLYEIKTVTLPNKVHLYFTNSFLNNIETYNICCVDKNELTYKDDCLYDMESYGIMEALSNMTLKENIFMFKVISDNLNFRPKNIKNLP